jgi:hypothetical protein
MIPGSAEAASAPPAMPEAYISGAVIFDDAFLRKADCNCDPHMLIQVTTDCDPDFYREPPFKAN